MDNTRRRIIMTGRMTDEQFARLEQEWERQDAEDAATDAQYAAQDKADNEAWAKACAETKPTFVQRETAGVSRVIKVLGGAVLIIGLAPWVMFVLGGVVTFLRMLFELITRW